MLPTNFFKIGNVEYYLCKAVCEEHCMDKVLKFLIAAGEEKRSGPVNSALESLLFGKGKVLPADLCRKVIRKHLVQVNQHQNLFIPHDELPLPVSLKTFLVYEQSETKILT